MQIQPLFLTIGNLLSSRLFSIPEYQRAYSWGSKQRDDLFLDISRVQAKGGDATHFMATVVGLRRGKVSIGADEYEKLEIVDGQQRITTIVILLKSIELALDQTKDVQKSLQVDLRRLLLKGNDDRLLLLQTNHDSSQIFAAYIRDGVKPKAGSANTVADQNLVDAIRDAEEFVSTWIGSSSLVELVALIRNRLAVIFHEIHDEALVYSVFEVLNSRGLDVTWFDKLKSLLMAVAFEFCDVGSQDTVAELHQKWKDIYRTLGLRQGLNQETVRFAGTLVSAVKPARPLSEEASVSQLMARTGERPLNALKTSQWLLEVSKAVDRLLSDQRRRAVSNIMQARLLAVAIMLRGYPEAREEVLLRKWEKVTFRIYGMAGNDARTGVASYVKLAWRIINEKLSYSQVLDELDVIGAIAPIDKALKELFNANCYEGWTEELRYFLFRYEEHLAAGMGQSINQSVWNKIWHDEPSKSIEHIQPQSSGRAYVHRLGNLTMLPPGINSHFKDRPPAMKAKEYEHCGLHDPAQVGRGIKKTGWQLSAIEAREKKLLKWAATEWGD